MEIPEEIKRLVREWRAVRLLAEDSEREAQELRDWMLVGKTWRINRHNLDRLRDIKRDVCDYRHDEAVAAAAVLDALLPLIEGGA